MVEGKMLAIHRKSHSARRETPSRLTPKTYRHKKAQKHKEDATVYALRSALCPSNGQLTIDH